MKKLIISLFAISAITFANDATNAQVKIKSSAKVPDNSFLIITKDAADTTHLGDDTVVEMNHGDLTRTDDTNKEITQDLYVRREGGKENIFFSGLKGDIKAQIDGSDDPAKTLLTHETDNNLTLTGSLSVSAVTKNGTDDTTYKFTVTSSITDASNDFVNAKAGTYTSAEHVLKVTVD